MFILIKFYLNEPFPNRLKKGILITKVFRNSN